MRLSYHAAHSSESPDTDWQDENFAPEFALSPERQALVKEVPFNDHIVHGVKGKDIENQGNRVLFSGLSGL
jgi:hypothetical protein